jgi:hypothetical protein
MLNAVLGEYKETGPTRVFPSQVGNLHAVGNGAKVDISINTFRGGCDKWVPKSENT